MDWRSEVLFFGATVSVVLLVLISRNVERLVEEARRIRIAMEKMADHQR